MRAMQKGNQIRHLDFGLRILITNDDGIEATGLDVLEKIATDLTDDVWVVAPETDNSGASHSLTLAEPLRMRELAKRHYAVKGTPTDCVIMGVRFLLQQQPPDLVLSGRSATQMGGNPQARRTREFPPA
jgi:5'-nucleotidase